MLEAVAIAVGVFGGVVTIAQTGITLWRRRSSARERRRTAEARRLWCRATIERPCETDLRLAVLGYAVARAKRDTTLKAQEQLDELGIGPLGPDRVAVPPEKREWVDWACERHLLKVARQSHDGWVSVEIGPLGEQLMSGIALESAIGRYDVDTGEWHDEALRVGARESRA